MEVQANFAADWQRFMRTRLSSFGYDTSEIADGDKLGFAFFNVMSRLVSARPRKIFEAQQLSCPPASTAGYEALKRKIEAGTNVCAHLSRGIFKAQYNDGLLNDWGIHHLHLGDSHDDDGFVRRSDDVLFAWFTDAAAHCIAFRPHGKWSDQM